MTAWALAAGAAYVNVVPAIVGAGSVGIIIAGPGPSVASTQLVAAVQAAINIKKPVTAYAIVAAATLVPQAVTVALSPDSTVTRAAGANALQLFFTQSAKIGSTLFVSRLDNALSSASGEYSHERTVPSADVTVTATQMLVLGTITWL